MADIWKALHSHGFGWRDAADVLVVGFLIYAVVHQIRGTRAVQMLLGILLLVAGKALAGWANLVTLHRVLDNLLYYMPFAVIVLFQPTIQRALASLGSVVFGRRVLKETERRACREVAKASFHLASKNHGALVVLERTQGLKPYAESGIFVRAQVSSDLLSTLFFPGSALHDGAVILAGDEVLAAGCFLPLTDRPLPMQYGTRHRAAVGITEESDAIAVVVSEERGQVSMACDGALMGIGSAPDLERILARVMAGGSLEKGEADAPAL